MGQIGCPKMSVSDYPTCCVITQKTTVFEVGCVLIPFFYSST